MRIWATYSRYNPPSLNSAFEQALQRHRARRQQLNPSAAIFSSSLNHLLANQENSTSNLSLVPQLNYNLEQSFEHTNEPNMAAELNSSTRAMHLSTTNNTVGSFHVDLRSSTMAVNDSENDSHQQQSPFGLPTSTEQAFGVPEKFLDPITFQLMLDPVILPSKHIVDRSTSILYLIIVC